MQNRGSKIGMREFRVQCPVQDQGIKVQSQEAVVPRGKRVVLFRSPNPRTLSWPKYITVLYLPTEYILPPPFHHS